MYRLYFNPKLAKWQVQMLKFGIVYINVDKAVFDTIEEAKTYVTRTGIDQHYAEQSYKQLYLQQAQGAR